MRHLLTTLEGDDLMGADDATDALVCGSLGLGGWLSDASSYTSKTITSAKNSGIPGLTQIAEGTRAAGQAISNIGSNIKTGSSTQVVQVPGYQIPQDNTMLYVAGAAVLAFLLLKGR